MTTTELIRAVGIRHLRAQDVERIEEAMNTADTECVLAVVDDLVGNARKSVTQKDRRQP